MKTRLLRHGGLPRGVRIAVVLFLILSVFQVAHIRHALAQRRPEQQTALGKEKVFITSIHWNNGEILKSHWVPGVIALSREFGRDNVFVSVQESGSWDDSKDALRTLDQELTDFNIPHQITLDPTMHADEVKNPPAEAGPGWIWTPRSRVELRRIPYLARLRNYVLEPLHELQLQGVTFDKVLFLGDVIFTTADIRRLLATRDGQYAAACALDFSIAPLFYDTFALRDIEGHDALTSTWPFFRASRSRTALLANKPVPVRSCWNGIVAMDAAPFYGNNLSFRGDPDGLAKHHIEGSECCLIHSDNALSPANGVWLNPQVRVAYNEPAYQAVNPRHGPWLSTFEIIKGVWVNRAMRWMTTTWFKNHIVSRKVSNWRLEDPANHEAGSFCLINEMQVLVENGWAHV